MHPQKWPEDLDYAGKRVVVIGSGATAVTLVPEMAKTAAHVTMLQRSPTYVVARPAEDALANWLRTQALPAKLAYHMIRWRNVLFGMYFFQLVPAQARAAPSSSSSAASKWRSALTTTSRTHFTPTYNPWDQRLCLVPDGDLFKAIRDKHASVVTDQIETLHARAASS